MLHLYIYIHSIYVYSYHISVCSEGFMVGRSVASVGSLYPPSLPSLPSSRRKCRSDSLPLPTNFREKAPSCLRHKQQAPSKHEATSDDCDSTDSTEGLHAEDFPGATGSLLDLKNPASLFGWTAIWCNIEAFCNHIEVVSCMYLWDPSDRETWWNMSQSIFTVELGSYNKTYAVTYWCLACSLRRHFIILKSMSLLSRPVKRNRPVTISKTVHPALHTSEKNRKNGLGSTEKQVLRQRLGKKKSRTG